MYTDFLKKKTTDIFSYNFKIVYPHLTSPSPPQTCELTHFNSGKTY